MDGLNHPKVFFPGGVRTSSTCETACNVINFLKRYAERNWSDNGVNDLANLLFGSASAFKAFASRSGPSDRTLTSFPSGRVRIAVTVFVVPSSRAFFISGIVNVMLGRPWCRCGCSDEFAEVASLNKLFYFIP